MGLFQLPGDDFLKDTLEIANEANGFGVAMKPNEVGMTHQGLRPRIRQAGAKLGLTGLITGIAEEGIDKHVTPFLIDRITEGAQGIAAAVRNPEIMSRPIANLPIASFRSTLMADRAKAKSRAKSRVNEAGNYTKPGLRKQIFNRIKAGSKGGKPGQWSARKAQMMAKEYKAKGGGYKD